MRAVQITRFGGPEVLDIVDLPDPVPGPGQQLYDVSTAGTFVAFNGEGPGWSTLNDHSGKLVVNADGRSGTIDVTLSPVPGSTKSPIRISGSWRCPA